MVGEKKKGLRFLFISSDTFPPFRVDSSILFGEEMIARGHKVDWLLQSEEQCKHSYMTEWSGCRMWVGATDVGELRLNRLRKHVLCILHQLRMFGLLRSNQYDFIQVKNKYLIALPAALFSRIFRTKFIFWLSYPHAEECLYKVKERTARYPVFYYIKGHLLTFLMYKIIMPSAYHVFVQSDQMKKDIMAHGIDECKLTPVPMGVSLNEFRPYREASAHQMTGIDDKRKSIVYLGTIQSSRKMDFMVRVLHMVLKEEPNTVFYIVGDGDDEKDRLFLEKVALDLGVADSLVITGFLPRKEAMAYVKAADVCVSPFCPSPLLDSTSPTKLVEYMAMEKSVVANDHPEQRLVIEQSGGGLCVPYEEAAFSEAILDLLRNPKRAEEMGIHGRKYVERYRDYRRIADLLESKYFELCSCENDPEP